MTAANAPFRSHSTLHGPQPRDACLFVLSLSVFFFFSRPPRPARGPELFASSTPGKACHLLGLPKPALFLPDQATTTSKGNAFVVSPPGVRKRKKRLNLMEETMKKKNETKPTNKPVHRIRVGAVSCSVFLNKTKEGTEFPSAVISRSYKSGDSFKDSNSYGARHLAELAALLAGLQSWMTSNYPEAAN